MTKIYDKYYITRTGKVFSRKSGELKRLKTYLTISGYEQVDLYIDGNYKKCLVHRLVAKAFIPNPEDKAEVNHINGKKADNHVNNLEWISRGDNLKHSYEFLGQTPVRNFVQASLYKDGIHIKDFESKRSASRYAVEMYSCSMSMIEKHRKHKGCEVRCND